MLEKARLMILPNQFTSTASGLERCRSQKEVLRFIGSNWSRRTVFRRTCYTNPDNYNGDNCDEQDFVVLALS